METELFEAIRQRLTALINTNPQPRWALEAECGTDNVWDTQELTRDFDVISFAAPFCIVIRKRDRMKGSVMFQHAPRFYFQFVPYDKERGSS